MSSPIHHAEDLDEALQYAPPWAREQGLREPLRPAAQLVRSPRSLRRLDLGGQAFSGDLAMAKLQRQLALDPDAVPEPPVDDIQSLWPMALRLCAVAGVAAAVAWLVISLPGTRLLRNEVARANVQLPPPVPDTPKQDPLRTPAAAGLLLQHGHAGHAGARAAANGSAAEQRCCCGCGAAARQPVARFRRNRHAAQARQGCFQHRRSGRGAAVVATRRRSGQRGSGAGARRHVRSAGHPQARCDRRRAGRRAGAAMVPKGRRARLAYGIPAAGPA
jgi:hypothetical protein